jgi:hypothetical protein
MIDINRHRGNRADRQSDGGYDSISPNQGLWFEWFVNGDGCV